MSAQPKSTGTVQKIPGLEGSKPYFFNEVIGGTQNGKVMRNNIVPLTIEMGTECIIDQGILDCFKVDG